MAPAMRCQRRGVARAVPVNGGGESRFNGFEVQISGGCAKSAARRRGGNLERRHRFLRLFETVDVLEDNLGFTIPGHGQGLPLVAERRDNFRGVGL